MTQAEDDDGLRLVKVLAYTRQAVRARLPAGGSGHSRLLLPAQRRLRSASGFRAWSRWASSARAWSPAKACWRSPAATMRSRHVCSDRRGDAGSRTLNSRAALARHAGSAHSAWRGVENAARGPFRNRQHRWSHVLPCCRNRGCVMRCNAASHLATARPPLFICGCAQPEDG